MQLSKSTFIKPKAMLSGNRDSTLLILLSLLISAAIWLVYQSNFAAEMPAHQASAQQAGLAAAGTADSDSTNGFVVLELFTSQGCSSCPPADRLLGEIAMTAENTGVAVYALSFHVDYWDYLGWKDPFSSKAYSDRQRRYAGAFKSSRIYTPQLVVNGREEFVGSHRQKAEQAMRRGLSRKTPGRLQMNATINKAKNQMEINWVLSGKSLITEGSNLNLALVIKDAANAVKRGENRGKRLKHYNVVTTFLSREIAGAKSGTSFIALPKNFDSGDYRLIGYLQHQESMEILTAGAATFQ